MEVEKLASSPPRTGRHLQRYNRGLRQVVGCIPYRTKRSIEPPIPSSLHGSFIEDVEVLLITSQKSPRLMLPKGGWELDENIELAASRETLEEAGVVGLLGEKLGEWIFKSKSQDKHHQGCMFPLLVTEELDVWPEKDVRRRVWMNIAEAREACSQAWMKEALDAFVCWLTSLRRIEEEPFALCSRLAHSCRADDLLHGLIGSQSSADEDVDRYLIT